MLILSRRQRESIRIGDDIEVTALGLTASTVRLGIKAPRSIAVHRHEIYERIRAGQELFAAEVGTGPELAGQLSLDEVTDRAVCLTLGRNRLPRSRTMQKQSGSVQVGSSAER